jgi:hypothetical protein
VLSSDIWKAWFHDKYIAPILSHHSLELFRDVTHNSISKVWTHIISAMALVCHGLVLSLSARSWDYVLLVCRPWDEVGSKEHNKASSGFSVIRTTCPIGIKEGTNKGRRIFPNAKIPIPRVCIRYLKIHLSVDQWSSIDVWRYWHTLFIVKDKSCHVSVRYYRGHLLHHGIS